MNLNARQPGESTINYRARRRFMAQHIKKYLRGQLGHASSEGVHLPVVGADPKVDAAVFRGDYRNVALVTLLGGTQMRVGRTKGAVYKRSREVK